MDRPGHQYVFVEDPTWGFTPPLKNVKFWKKWSTRTKSSYFRKKKIDLTS